MQGKTSGLTAGQEPAVCELPQEIPEPVNACGVKPVGGLVQQQQLGVTEQRSRQPEALSHPQRVRRHQGVGGRFKLDELSKIR